jgi:hypothetical protein
MTDTQILTIVLGALPATLAVLVGILLNNARLSDLRQDVIGRFDRSDRGIEELRVEMNRRFDDMRDMWRSELRRVEEILDARLKHLEERD